MTIEITTKEQMALIGNDEAYPLNGDYLLMNDIDLEGDDDNQWTPIAPLTNDEAGNPTLLNRFSGNFEGNGKTISGLYINDISDDAYGYALFGVVFGGTVRHLRVKGSITTRNDETGGDGMAGLVAAVCGGGIVEECESGVDVTGYSYVAGIAAFIYSGGTILNCKSTGTITGTVFVGGCLAVIADFEATKDVAFISKCVHTGDIIAGGAVHPFVAGIVFAPVLADPQIYFASDRCYWDYTVSGVNVSYAGEHKTTAELKQQETFVHWNFNTVWGIDEGATYPYLLCLQKVTMPDVVGSSLSEAYTSLEALGFTVAVTLSCDSEYGAGIVCAQSEAAGSSISYDTKITISVSLGPEAEAAPDTGNVVPMSDMLRSGVAWLGQKRVANCSSQVAYQRPPDAYTVNATYGRTSVEVADETGMTIVSKVWDFLIQANELGFDPEPGDVIVADGRRHEVMNLNGECWRWSDPYRTAYRIHTKDIGAA